MSLHSIPNSLSHQMMESMFRDFLISSPKPTVPPVITVMVTGITSPSDGTYLITGTVVLPESILSSINVLTPGELEEPFFCPIAVTWEDHKFILLYSNSYTPSIIMYAGEGEAPVLDENVTFILSTYPIMLAGVDSNLMGLTAKTLHRLAYNPSYEASVNGIKFEFFLGALDPFVDVQDALTILADSV